jgi:hypothetical protein
MSKSIYELALHYSGQAGCYRAAVNSLLADPSELNIKYWTKMAAEWEAEQEAFVGESEVESSTYYDPEEVDLTHLSSVMYGVDNNQQ